MAHPVYTNQEIAARGQTLYDQQLRDKIESENIGKYLVIDIETGAYELDEDGLAASERAYKKHPGGAHYGMRIGYRSWGQIGANVAAAKP